MEVPIRLVRSASPQSAADGFLLLADSPAPLASVCAKLDPWPRVFTVRGGFLLVSSGSAGSVPGTVRLRRQSGDLFIPADADLLPALLPDESAALTRDRGLVVLPGGTVLAFDPAGPLPVTQWLKPAVVRRARWEPFPPRPERPNALSVIERPAPPLSAVVDVLGAGAPDEADPLPGPGERSGEAVPEDARPPSGSLLGRTAAGAGLAAAGFLAWLGRQLGAEGLARVGGDLARRALRAIPRLSEQVLGAQEAALRAVLRELQTGDVEKGLRRAPPAVSDPGGPAQIGTDARLGLRDPRYSLRSLIGTGGGVASLWLGGGDVWAELAREYRRLAAEAAARGDHRRAAYLYGVLLRDIRAAANALLAGGMYRDAALLLRDRLNDPLGAADAFDRAGDHDEAVRLFERLGEHERAGDLLRRLGEDDRAARHYARAADRLAAAGRFLTAGDLMRNKAHRRDVAADFYRRGWRNRCAEAVGCGERLIDERLAAGDSSAVVDLWTEAEDALADWPRGAGRFFNYALGAGEGVLPAETHADLADRARLLFASHLRAHATIGEAGALVGDLFPVGATWGAPVARDASFVARPGRTDAPPRDRPKAGGISTVKRITAGAVTAVTVVRGTCDLVVASPTGIVLWLVADGRVVPIWEPSDPVTALAASARGERVHVLTRRAEGTRAIYAFVHDGSGTYLPTAHDVLPTDESDGPDVFLQPAATFHAGEHRVVVATPTECIRFFGSHLRQDPFEVVIDERPIRLLVEPADGYTWYWAGSTVGCRAPGEVPAHTKWFVSWVPAAGIDWLTPAPGTIEIVAADADGGLHWERFGSGSVSRGFAFHDAPVPYTTACLLAPGAVAAVTTNNDVCWLRAVGSKLNVTATAALGVPGRVVSLTALPDGNELVAVLADGHAVRIRRP